MSFQNRNILIIGASSGIGLALAKLLHGHGANVFTASRHQSPELAALNLPFLQYDVVTDTTENLIAFLPETLSGLAYCPGSINLKPFTRLSLADFQQDLNINLLGAVKTLQGAFKNLKAADGASVVLFSTVATSVGMGFHASVAASKSAVEGLAKSLASEWISNKINVNVVAPSLTDTPLAGNLLSTPEKREASGKRHPLGRVGTPEEIAKAAEYLLSEDASWVTGQIFKIDGGISSVR